MLVYLRQCLAASAGVEPDLESVNAMRDQAPIIARYVAKLLQEQPGEKGPIGVYINIIRQLLTAIGGSPAMYCLLEVVAVARQQLAPQFIKHLDWIKVRNVVGHVTLVAIIVTAVLVLYLKVM